MSIVNEPISPPAHAYTIMEQILGPEFFARSNPPNPPTLSKPGKGPGYRVQITAHSDKRQTQWDLWPSQWNIVKDVMIGKQDVTVRVVNAW